MRENQEFPVDFVGTFLKYNASAATFELKMYSHDSLKSDSDLSESEKIVPKSPT